MMIMMTLTSMDTMVVDVTTDGLCSDGTEIDDESRHISGRTLREHVLNGINEIVMHLNITVLSVRAL